MKFQWLDIMPKVKFTHYKGYDIMHGPLFYRLELDKEPWLVSCRTIKEVKDFIDNELIEHET